jgi:hypothetical protein
MSKVKIQYVGPELREFGGKHAGEKYKIPAAKVASVDTIENPDGSKLEQVTYKPRVFSVSQHAADALLGLPAHKRHGKLFVAFEGDDPDAEAEGTDTAATPEPEVTEDKSLKSFDPLDYPSSLPVHQPEPEPESKSFRKRG